MSISSCPPLAIAICEDTPQDSLALKDLLIELVPHANISLFSSGEAFLATDPANQFNLVFLDIYMADMTGIDTAQALRQQDKAVCIVFTTTSVDHALEGYRVRAMQYLIKPVQKDDVAEILSVCCPIPSAPDNGGGSLSFATNGQKYHLPLADILYVEARGKQSHIHTLDGIVETQTPIGELALLLSDPYFIRCHRSYIVNLAYVAKLDGDFTMTNGDIVYVRIKDWPDVNKSWNHYMTETLRREE